LTELDMLHHADRIRSVGISPDIHPMTYAESGMKLSVSRKSCIAYRMEKKPGPAE
jgi:hypothetical protein